MGPSGPFIFPLWKPAQEKVQAILRALEVNSFSCDSALVGVTSQGVAALEPLAKKGFRIDHNRVCIGSGQAVFERSRRAVRGWRHFQLGWAVVDPQTPVRRNELVAVVARSFGLLWTLNPLQIVYVDESVEQDRGAPQGRLKKAPENGKSLTSRTSRQSAMKKQGPRVVAAPPEEGVGTSTDSHQSQQKARFAYAHGTLRGHLLAGEERFLVEWKDDDTVWYDILTFSKPGHILSTVTYPAARFYQRQFAKQSMELMKAIAQE